MNKRFILSLSLIIMSLFVGAGAISVTIALFQRQSTLEEYFSITSAGARNNEIFLSRNNATDNTNVVWLDDANYEIYMLMFNSTLIENGRVNAEDKGISYNWVAPKTVLATKVKATYPNASATTGNQTANYYYFDFEPELYDRISFHRIEKTQINRKYDATGTIVDSGLTAGVPTLFEHRFQKDTGIGMSTNSTSVLVKPAKNNNNVFELKSWTKQRASDGFNSYGEWLQVTLSSDVVDPIDYTPKTVSSVKIVGSYKDHTNSWNLSTAQSLTKSGDIYSIRIDFYRNDRFLIVVNDDSTYNFGYSDITSGNEYANQGNSNTIAVNYQGNLTISFNIKTFKITLSTEET